MDLISCDNCGVILDKNKLKFPEDLWDEETEANDPNLGEWNGDGFTAILPCPVCKENIRENN